MDCRSQAAHNRFWAIFVALVCGSVCAVQAQPAIKQRTLTQQLLAEGATSLARAAREQGSAIRGAILYPQKDLNCVSCHSPGSQELGPNLTLIGKDVEDVFLVESILQPSKAIKKGFESVKVLTESGEVLVGRVVDRDDAKIVLRDPADAKRSIKLGHDEIAEIIPNDKSTMPDGLANQLTNRQQFLDLVKYLMDIADTAKRSD